MKIKPKLIFITGGTASGKTSLSNALANKIGEDKVTVLSVDDFYRDKNHFEDQNNINWDSSVNMELNNIEEEDSCEQTKDFNDAKEVADSLGVKITEINFVKEYWDRVFLKMIEDLKKGLTPNPDIICNKEIKFEHFVNYIFQNYSDFDFVATGHYATITRKNNISFLTTAKDKIKDQTYFLAEVNKDIFGKIIFPLGTLEKTQVRELAENFNLINKNKKDSTGICFIGKRNFVDFISNYIDEQPGDILEEGTDKKIGEHRGAIFYTIGQRKGLNLGGMNEPYFITSKDLDKNILYASSKDHDLLYSTKVTAIDFNFLSSEKEIEIGQELIIKTRHGARSYEAIVLEVDYINKTVSVESKEKIFSPTPGQELVLYNNTICLGGGSIV